jgi:putative endonuclease
VRERQPCVYILASGFNGTLYVGVTADLPKRLMQHREGLHGGFTKQHNVKRLVWYELTDEMTAASASEKRIKKWPRDWKKNLIECENPEWNDLAVVLGFEPLP